MPVPSPPSAPSSPAPPSAPPALRATAPDGPFSIELTGPTASLAFPAVCAACATPTSTRLTIQKVFVRETHDSPRDYVIGEARVPFCPACVAKHERQEKRVGRLWRMLLCFRSGLMISALGATLFAGLLAQAALQRATRSDLRSVEVLGGIALFCALAAAVCTWLAYDETRRFAIPEQTAVTRAFEFSDDRSSAFDLSRRLYRLTNPTFAEAFGRLNQARVWDPASPKAVRASRQRWVVGALIVAFAIVMALIDPIRRLLGW